MSVDTSKPKGKGVLFFEAAERHIRRTRGKPDTWQWCRVEWIGSSLLIEGGSPIGTWKSGPRKGRPKWDAKKIDKTILTPDEIKELNKEIDDL